MTNLTSSEYSDGSAQETSSHERQGKNEFSSFAHILELKEGSFFFKVHLNLHLHFF